MRALRDEGWSTITLGELHAHLSSGAPLPEKPIVLTFDDGYLDNWVFAYPILKKYGHHAVIWMSTDFIDPCTEPRPNLEDCREGRVDERELGDLGFLSWAEMRRMTASGHIEIQSHAQTHTWYFSGPDILDFHRPLGVDGYVPYPWLAWNLFPERKYEYMKAHLEENVPHGTPVYSHGKALETRRYFEDEDLTARLVEAVRGGGPAFFDRKGWRGELESIIDRYPPRNDRVETEQEYHARVKRELIDSRRIIEEALGTKVEFLCWPGGGRTPETLRIAEEVGYLATTTHFQDPSRRNEYGQNPREIGRTGCGSPWSWRNRHIWNTDPGFFIESIKYFLGDKKSIWTLRRYKLKYLFRYFLLGRA
jgi:peptidoglycan/xylan/chitin deacetylase (PgdA/CDA1 family)